MPVSKPPAKEKPVRGTWRDWLPADIPETRTLIHRDEMFERLRRFAFKADLSDIQFWEREGIIPKATLQWDPTVKARRAYYPRWMVGVIALIRVLQDQGLSLREIAPHLYPFAARIAREFYFAFEYHDPEDITDDVIDGTALTNIPDEVFSIVVMPQLIAYTRTRDAFSLESPTRSVEVIFTNTDRKKSPTSFLVPPPDGTERRPLYSPTAILDAEKEGSKEQGVVS